jgi:hypothetical protein
MLMNFVEYSTQCALKGQMKEAAEKLPEPLNLRAWLRKTSPSSFKQNLKDVKPGEIYTASVTTS